MEKAIQDKFKLTATEIDRFVEETADLLAGEKIDPKDALRLRFLLEETILKYRDALSEDAEALAIIISVNAVLEFLTVAVNNYCLQSQIVLLGKNFVKLDRDRLKA